MEPLSGLGGPTTHEPASLHSLTVPSQRPGLVAALPVLVVLTAVLPSPPAWAAPAGSNSLGVTRELLPDGQMLTTAPLVSDGASGREFSPAGCRIVYVDDPHFSVSVPGGIKVNAKVQCNTPVESLESGRPYANLAFGNVSKPLACGYDGA